MKKARESFKLSRKCQVLTAFPRDDGMCSPWSAGSRIWKESQASKTADVVDKMRAHGRAENDRSSRGFF